MKRLLLIVTIISAFVTASFAQTKPVATRTPDGPQFIGDANLKATKYLIVPISSVTGITGGTVDSAGYIRYNPSTKNFEGYYGPVHGWGAIGAASGNIVAKADSNTFPGYVTRTALKDSLANNTLIFSRRFKNVSGTVDLAIGDSSATSTNNKLVFKNNNGDLVTPNIVYAAGSTNTITYTGMKIVASGGLQIPTGASSGYVLTSDGSGNASWSAGGTTNIYNHNGTLTGNRYFNGGFHQLHLDSLSGYYQSVAGTDALGEEDATTSFYGNTNTISFSYWGGDYYAFSSSDDGTGNSTMNLSHQQGSSYESFSFDNNNTGIKVIDQLGGYGLVASTGVDSTKMGTGSATYATGKWVINRIKNYFTAVGGATSQSVTFNNSGSGASSGAFFNGTAAKTISYNTIGAQAALSGTGFVKISGSTISYDNSTYLTTAAASSTYQLASNIETTLTNSTYLYPSGSAVTAAIAAISVPTGANPTGSAGLTAVNGSATTFMRSDAAPAINQGIAPTWTSQHNYQLNSLGTTIAASNASIFVANTTAATSGTQQYSPLIGWQAQYYNTTASASRSVAAYWGLQSQSGTGYAYLAMYASIDGGTPAYNGVEISLTGSMIAGAYTSSSTFTTANNGIGVTSTDGYIMANATAATNSLAQWSRRSRQSSFYWTGSTSNQAEATEELQTTTSNTAQYVISGRTGGSGSFNPYFGISVINGNWSLNGTAGTTGQVPSSTGSGMQWITPISLTSLSATTPLSYNNTTGAFTIQQASGSQPGYLASADWTTFNGKQAALSGTGFVKISGTTISYDNSTYLTTTTAASTYSPIAGSSSIVTVGSLTSGSIPYSLLSGTVPTWNQNTTGTAANITATSNSTLTTLSALSLPYSQITGTPSLSGYIPYTGATGNVTLGSYSITASQFLAGTLGYTDTGILGALQSSVNGYNQFIIQNTNTGSSASANLVLNNSASSATNYYGETGINGVNFSNGSGSLNGPGNVYFDAVGEDIVVGTFSNNAIHLVANNNATDAITISGSNAISFPQLSTNGLLKTSGGTGAVSVAVAGTDYVLASNFVTSEVPSGTINGSNTSFTLANTPVTGTIRLFRNGVRTTAFTASGSTITMSAAPLTGDTLLVDYQK